MNWLYGIGRLLTQAVLDGGFAGDCSGVENIPARGPFILACNHASFFDPPAVGRLVPREIAYFARKSLFKPGPIASILTRVNAIPVDRDGGADLHAIKRVLAELKRGRGILFFPEGTRSPDGALQDPEPGIGMIALKTGAPVIPCRIFGSHEAFGRDHCFPLPPAPVSVAFSPPLPPGTLDPGPASADRYGEAARRIMTAIAALPPPPASRV